MNATAGWSLYLVTCLGGCKGNINKSNYLYSSRHKVNTYLKNKQVVRQTCLPSAEEKLVPNTLEKLFKSSSSVYNCNPWNAAKVSETNSRVICWVIARWQVKQSRERLYPTSKYLLSFSVQKAVLSPPLYSLCQHVFWKLLKNVNCIDSPCDSADAPWLPLPHMFEQFH